MRRLSRRATLTFGALTVLVSAVGIFLARDDWNWAKPAVCWAVGRATGRSLEIRGDLRVDLGFHTEAEAADLHFGNADWAAAPEMFSARRLALRLRLLPLLAGRLRLERLEVDRAHLDLEKRASGEGNWTFGDSHRQGDPISLPWEIVVRQSDLTLTDPARPRGFALHVDTVDSRRFGGVRLVAATGQYQAEPFRVRLGLLGIPAAGGGRTRAALRGSVGTTRASADGWVGDGSASPLLEARLAAEGASLDDIWQLIGFPLPHTPPFEFDGKLAYSHGRISIERLSGRLGKSDLAGEIAIDMARGKRMLVEADVHSRALDLDDVEGFWGRPPREERQQEPAASGNEAVSLFPDLRFELQKLRVADARIRFAADRLLGKSVLDDVRVTASLDDGVLELHPLELGLSAGDVTANATLDARAAEPVLSAELVVRHVRLDELLARAGAADGAGGEFGGRAELRTHGSSLRELARHADGEVGVVLQEGWISDPLLELLALHLGGYIRARLDKDDPGPIRCLVGLFEAEKGVLEAQSLLLDTSHVRIEGEGKIDLGREEIDLELKQHSKHLTFGALRTPIEIVGPLTSRTARLKPGPLALRGGAALALGAIHPAAALLALIDPGSDDKPGACREALAEYREIAPEVAAGPAHAGSGPGAP